MKADALLTTSPDNTVPHRKSFNVPFLAVLTLIAATSLLIRWYVSANGMMDFDEWQHVFMASGARWADLRYELDTNAHPPLFFVLLRSLLHIGHSKVLYRSISILSGTASVFLIGLIARKVCRNVAIALLCAGAFGLSGTAITISGEVRSYQLAISFVLLAFLSYLEMLSEEPNRVGWRPYVLFAAATSMAVSCHYFAALFLGATLAVPFLLATISGDYRRRLSPFKNGRALLRLAVSLTIPLCALLTLYFSHARNQPIQGYLYDFYFGFSQIPHETQLAFTLRNLQNIANLFSPVVFQSRPIFLSALALVCFAAISVVAVARRAKTRDMGTLDLTFVFVLTMVSELIVLSLKRLYPFGGLMRHQYIVAPFLVVAAFLLLDRLVSLLIPVLRVAALILICGCIALNASVVWPTLIVGRGIVIYQREFDDYRAAFPDARAVYLDRFGIIGYFINTDDQPRRFVRRISDPSFIDQYSICGGSPEGTQIFYDKSRDNLDLADPTVYRSFAACLRQSRLKELTLFFFTAGNRPFEKPPAILKQLVIDTAAQQGLAATKVVVDGTAVYAAFTLKS